MDNPETMHATLGTQDTGKNGQSRDNACNIGYTRHRKEWTIQRQCMQHWVHKTQERMDNPETMHATLGTQDTGKNGQSRDNACNIGYTRHRKEWTIQRQCMQHWVHKTQERMDNPETMHATLGTQDTGKNGQSRDNACNIGYTRHRKEWTIQRQCMQHWVHKTQDKDKQSKTHKTEN